MGLIVLSLWINKMLNYWKNQEVTLPEELRDMAIFSERNFKEHLFSIYKEQWHVFINNGVLDKDCYPP